jgi:hypothetical protein
MAIQINRNDANLYVTEHTIGNVTTMTTLFAVDREEDDIPMIGCEVGVYVDGTRNADLSCKGYIMPFRRYCFSVQSGTGNGSAQLYTTGSVAQDVFAEYISRDTYGDVFIVPQIIECVTALGGHLSLRRIRGVNQKLMQNFKAQVINWVMNRSGLKMSADQQKFVDGQLRQKKSVEDFTPEELMAAVLRGDVKITF